MKKNQILSFLVSRADRGEMRFTNAEILEATSLTKMAVRSAVNKLRRKGYILAAGQEKNGRATVYAINESMELPPYTLYGTTAWR